MMLLKGLQWFEWLLIGVMVAVLGVTWIVWDKYDEQLVENGGIKATNTTLVETVKHKDASAAITDVVVADFILEKEDVRLEQDISREGVINDYINMAGGPTVNVQQVATNPKTPVPQSTPPKVRPTEPKPNSASDSARLGVLVDRMHEHYCAATPSRGNGCATSSVNQ